MGSLQFGQRRLTPYLFMLPVVVMLLTFVYVPIIQSMMLSLYRWSSINPVRSFVGLENYRTLIADPFFWGSVRNNIWYALISITIQVGVALVLAAILESGIIPRWAASIFRTSLFLPSVLATAIVGVTWQLLYRPEVGLINQLLTAVGLGGLTRAWLGEEGTAIFAIITVTQWQYTGYIMLLFIVAIRAIPRELYESARIDGASGVQQFFHITVPSVHETTLVMVAVTVISAFKVFDSVWVMTGGGPNRASEVLGTYLYRTGFRNDEMGYASAIATVLFGITFVLTYIQLHLGRTGQET